jgi:hypothetical protein
MAIARPTTKTKISTTEWGWPVTDAVNANTTDIAALKTATTVTPWTALTLTNGWTNVGGFGTAQYRKVGDMVQLRGLVTGGAISAVIGNLPAGFRPLIQMTVPFAQNGVGANYLSLTPNGDITPAANGYVSLSGIAFSIS